MHSPLLCVFAGHDVTLSSDGSPCNLPNARERAQIVANNPAAAAKYFHFTIETVLDKLLRYGHEDGGVLGHVSGYYGIMEEQGRGKYTCAILMWFEFKLVPYTLVF